MKIYRIISDLPDGRFLCYIGSTSKDLSTRLLQHKAHYYSYLRKGKSSYCTSYKIISKKYNGY